MSIRAVAALSLLIALAGCGESVDPPHARPDPPSRDPESAPATGPLPDSRRVVCDGRELVSGNVDYVMEAPGAPTPEQAVLGWVRPAPDQHLAVDQSPDAAQVLVVRSDGTVSGVLDLQRTSTGGWVVGRFEGCAGDLHAHPSEPSS